MIRLTSIGVTSVLALGLCGIAGALVGLGHDDKGPRQAATTAPITQEKKAAGQAKASQQAADVTTTLLKTRPGVAQKGYDATFEALRFTVPDQPQKLGDVLEEVYRWSIRWLQAERDLSRKESDHHAALEAHLKRMTDLQNWVIALNRELLADKDKLAAEWYVLEARLWLEQAKTKRHSEPSPRDP